MNEELARPRLRGSNCLVYFCPFLSLPELFSPLTVFYNLMNEDNIIMRNINEKS